MLIHLFLLGALASGAPLSLLNSGEHCVAYQASKTLFLVAKTKVVGRSCLVSAQVTPGLEDKYSIEVRVPSNSFESGEKKRDEDVTKILGGAANDVMFRTDMKSAAEWNQLINQDSFTIPGVIIINGQEHSVTAEAARASVPEGYEIDGVIKTTLKHLNIQPPDMVGGLFAKVQNNIELHFHLKGERTLGSATVLNPVVVPAASPVAATSEAPAVKATSKK